MPFLIREIWMFDRRAVVTLLASAGVIAGVGTAFAKGHKHHNGHDLLGAKLKQNGKHQVGKAGKENVTAEVSNGKIVSMTAGSIAARKVKTKKKMVSLDDSSFKIASNGQFSQMTEVYYYGYEFDDGVDVYYYWYPASDVVVDTTWVEYVPA